MNPRLSTVSNSVLQTSTCRGRWPIALPRSLTFHRLRPVSVLITAEYENEAEILQEKFYPGGDLNRRDPDFSPRLFHHKVDKLFRW